MLKYQNKLKTSQKVFWVFFLTAVAFVISMVFDLTGVAMVANVLLVPILILYYRYRTKNWFVLAVLALGFFYVRDLLPYMGYERFSVFSQGAFFGSASILALFAVSGLRKARVHVVEWISLLIMYAFLGFVFYTILDLIPEVMNSGRSLMYIHLLLLIFLLAVTFTRYLLKAHYASLWMMLACASLLISELSLFFRIYVVDDFSVRLFFPLFHVISFYAWIEHVVHRRRSERIPLV